MRDAIRMSIDHLHDKAKHDKKVIIVVTDGNDNASMVTLDSAGATGAAGWHADLRDRAAERRRQVRSGQGEAGAEGAGGSTGGQVFYPKEVAEVEPIAHEVAHDIRNQYSIWYAPLNDKLDNTFRSIKVVVKGPGGPVARTRQGYWATPSRKPSGSGKPPQ